ncbi:MAG: UPF0280 family protein [Desulfobulbus sp.]|jgi:ApbE superfamily uncharacterized protein (UPF0280 family)
MEEEPGRVYRSFSWKETNLRIAATEAAFELITRTVMAERRLLERYLARDPEFRGAMVPVAVAEDAPVVVRRMAAAARTVGVGPMAAVAGALAQMGAEAAMAAGYDEAIVENGGDMFIHSARPVTVGLFAGTTPLADRLAFRLVPASLPLALCSSSSAMGHSLSLGRCDLATVVSADAALADAAVTLVCNLIRSERDLDPVLNDVGTLPGIAGILAVKGKKIGLFGNLPELVRNRDKHARAKITRDLHSDFRG